MTKKAIISRKKMILTYTSVISALILVSAISYINFQAYKPKVLREISEIRGFNTTDHILDFPYIKGTKELGVTETELGRQVTLEVPRTAEDVHSFYTNVLMEKGWEIENSIERSDLIINKYKKNDYFLTVSISKDTSSGETLTSENNSNTVVGIDLIEQ